MSHQQHLSHQQHPPPAASRLAKLWVSLAALAVVAASLAAIAVSQPATAQLQPLDPALCATTYKPTSGAGARTEADCRTIVAWRNAVVSDPRSVIGTDHPMAVWGTGMYTKFNNWKNPGDSDSGIILGTVDGQLIVHRIILPGKRLAGPLPGNLPNITYVALENNFLRGGLPTWIYGAKDLRFLDLRSNQLSGTITGSAFNTPKLVNFLVQHNRFSGPVPNFNFNTLSKLTDIRLSNNRFEGDIPAGWSVLDTSNRGMQRLQLKANYITGNLPSWVSNLQFANSFSPWHIAVGSGRDYYVDFRDNQLCIPSTFTLPLYLKLNGQRANVQAYFGNNRCPTGQPSTTFDAAPASNVQFQRVDADGNPTDPNDENDIPVAIKVTWSRPKGADATTPLTYIVRMHVTQDIRDSNDCLNENFDIPEVTNALATNELTIRASHCSVQAGFNPRNYSVSVSTAIKNGETVSAGRSAISNDWSVYMMDDAQKTYRDVAGVLGLDYNRNIWRWDAVNQVWQQRSQLQLDFASLNLETGSALAIEKRVIPSWLPLAGLSTADADTPVELQNGWNVISAGGDAERGDDENGAFFIDDGLIDCSSAQGAVAILRNVPGTQRFDIELPCHPSRERAITRGQAYRTIGEIEELDTLFIYFRSVLPVTISWDNANSRYAPAN